jgi:hypothetical protein
MTSVCMNIPENVIQKWKPKYLATTEVHATDEGTKGTQDERNNEASWDLVGWQSTRAIEGHVSAGSSGVAAVRAITASKVSNRLGFQVSEHVRRN